MFGYNAPAIATSRSSVSASHPASRCLIPGSVDSEQFYSATALSTSERYFRRYRGSLPGDGQAGMPALPGLRRVHNTSPSDIHMPSARYSYRPKLPGTDGTTFIRISIAAIVAPLYPTIFNLLDDATPPAPLQNARRVASQPTAAASEPTSEIGTSTACPRNEATTVKQAANATATLGVRKCSSTRASRASSSPRLPIANSNRVEVRKFPLKIFTNESNTANMINCTSARDPKARSKATAVANRSFVSDCQ